ncbi:MAG: acyl-CoA desaturase [Gammaproteobacteria bacterium]|nr:acyl-CoA desaturase [Gammaproteobacteria bacterium]
MRNSVFTQIINWFDSYAGQDPQGMDNQQQDAAVSPNWLRIIPFVIMHLACGAVIWVGWSPVAVIVALVFYAVRMVGITAFYHRYFAHKAFKTGRITQFVFALIGSAATQRGPLWWASHHRHHHYYSDTEEDVHSPRQGVFWSHMGWFLSDKYFRTRLDLIPDFARFKELIVLDRFDMLVPIACMLLMYGLGAGLNWLWPQLGTSGLQMLVWGYVISTVALLHATLCINSLAHRRGSRRFQTDDTSRNNLLLALITFGEGWHNNHHRFPNSARQGIRWWEIDLSYYLIKAMEKIGLVWNVKSGPTAEQIAIAIKQSMQARIEAQ